MTYDAEALCPLVFYCYGYLYLYKFDILSDPVLENSNENSNFSKPMIIQKVERSGQIKEIIQNYMKN